MTTTTQDMPKARHKARDRRRRARASSGARTMLRDDYESVGPVDRDGASAGIAVLRANLEQLMLEWLAKQPGLAADQLSAASEFSALGIDSVAIVELVVELEATIAQRLPDSTAFEYPTVGELAEFASTFAFRGKDAPHSAATERVTVGRPCVLPRFAARS